MNFDELKQKIDKVNKIGKKLNTFNGFKCFKPIKHDEIVYQIPYSEHYKGFKFFKVVVDGDIESEFNNAALCDEDLSQYSFTFRCFNYEDGRMATLSIGNKKVGAVFDPNQLYALEHNLIGAIHTEVKESVVLVNNGTKLHKRLNFYVKYLLEA